MRKNNHKDIKVKMILKIYPKKEKARVKMIIYIKINLKRLNEYYI
jgi:hypothetical protein